MAKVLPKNSEPKILPLRGTVHEEWKKCGKPSCRCAGGAGGKADQLHGPYYYRFERVNRRLRKRYVPRSEVEAVRAACRQRQEAEHQAREDCAWSREAFQLLREVRRSTREKVREHEDWKARQKERTRQLGQVYLWEPGTFARWTAEGLPTIPGAEYP